MAIDEAFKEAKHPFRIAIVCAMWLTGFDVPCLSNLYLDKPLKAHTLMQAIARANRVNEGKNNGLIIDYCGVLKHLRRALATFTVTQAGDSDEAMNPARPQKELLNDLREAIASVRDFLKKNNASLDKVIQPNGLELNAAIIMCREVANENDETRKRFEMMCRELFALFRACINIPEANEYRKEYDAINIIYKSLQRDREREDISDITRMLHRLVESAIDIREPVNGTKPPPLDISRTDFNALKREFRHSDHKNTIVQNLKHALEQRLEGLLFQNPLRANFQRHYEKIVADYNREKDRATIEQTFEALLDLTKELGEEGRRAKRENLNEESLAIFDLLVKPNLSPTDIKQIKGVSVAMLKTLKTKELSADQWRDKEETRAAVKVVIYNFLWNDKTGLPSHYSEEDIEKGVEAVFHHVYRAYPSVPSPYYEPKIA